MSDSEKNDSINDGHLRSAFEAALARSDASALAQLAAEAQRNADQSAAPLLVTVLVHSARRMPGDRARWIPVVMAVIDAAVKMRAASVLPAIVRLMLATKDDGVRSAANSAILAFGSDAVPALANGVRTERNWRHAGLANAIRGLGTLKPASADLQQIASRALTAILYGRAPRVPSSIHRASLGIATGLFSLFGLFCILPFLIAAIRSGMPVIESLLQALVFLVMVGFGSAFIIMMSRNHFARSGINTITERRRIDNLTSLALVELGDRRAIPAMTNLVMHRPHDPPGICARYVLTHLLPTVRAEDVSILTWDVRNTLTYVMERESDEALVIAILEALRETDSGTSLPTIELIGRRRPVGRVESVAMQVAADIRSRMDRLGAAKSLLRGSNAPISAPEEMLRPASAHGSAEPEELLRPSDSA